MPINAGYEFFNAEKAYLEATSIDQKISCLEEMIRTAPKHKSSENFVAGLKTRLKKLIEKKEKSKKTGKSSIRGIKKEGYQVVLVGFSNSGKSSILVKLTNAHSKISPVKFTTKSSQPGTLYYQGYHLQIIEVPAIESEFFDSGIINTADLILIIITKLEEYQRIIPYLSKATNNRLLIINKSDLLDSNQIRKLEETLRSKKLRGIVVSSITNHNIENLKRELIKDISYIRIYTKEPGKPHSPNPIMLPLHSTIKDVAESIRKGFSSQVKESRITGPSSKFSNQKTGLSHELKDLDIVEFHTK